MGNGQQTLSNVLTQQQRLQSMHMPQQAGAVSSNGAGAAWGNSYSPMQGNFAPPRNVGGSPYGMMPQPGQPQQGMDVGLYGARQPMGGAYGMGGGNGGWGISFGGGGGGWGQADNSGFSRGVAENSGFSGGWGGAAGGLY